MSVQAGATNIDVGAAVLKIDANREKIFQSISGSLTGKNYNLSPQIKALERLVDLSNRLSDQVRLQHPNQPQVQGWLRANALLASAWLNLLRYNVPFSGSAYGDEVAWIESIGTPLDGKLGRRIGSIRGAAANPDKERQLSAIAVLVQQNSDIAGKGRGILDCLASVTPRFADPGTNVVIQAVGNLKSESQPGEKVTFRAHVSGPQTSFQTSPTDVSYSQGPKVLAQQFAVDTSQFKPGRYEVTVFADDARGERRTALGMFFVSDKSPLPPPVGTPTATPAATPPLDQFVAYVGKLSSGVNIKLVLQFRRVVSAENKWTFDCFVVSGELTLADGSPSASIKAKPGTVGTPEFYVTGGTAVLVGQSDIITTGTGTFKTPPTPDSQTISGKVQIQRQRETVVLGNVGEKKTDVAAVADPGGTYEWNATRVP